MSQTNYACCGTIEKEATQPHQVFVLFHTMTILQTGAHGTGTGGGDPKGRSVNWLLGSMRKLGILAVGLGVVQCLMVASILMVVVNPTRSTTTSRVLSNTRNTSPYSSGEPTIRPGLDNSRSSSSRPRAQLNTANMTMEPVMAPVVQAGKMYTLCREDRSGSAISDMLYAHAYAFAHHLTYAGACCLKTDYPRKATVHLLHELQLDHFLPFGCPDGVGSHLNRPQRNTNATELSPLILNPNVYRDRIERQDFTAAWRESIQQIMTERSEASALKVLQSDRPFEIAVHIRRGDVSPCRHRQRYLPNDHFLTLIDQYTPATSERGDRPVHVTIYSENTSFEPFDAFRARNFTVELDTNDLAVVWRALATADVVILSRSFFSFVPATINPNVVVVTPFFGFEPLDGWNVVGDELVNSSDKLTFQMSRELCNEMVVPAKLS
jgi:hypothetical protein